MPVHPANNVEVLDEGVSQGFVRGIDFTGGGITATVSGSRATANVPAAAAPPVGADPTTQIGLAVVNGVAATFLRSDAAQALNQGIAPTWTAAHTFSLNQGVRLSGTAPELVVVETDGGVDGTRWGLRTDAGVMALVTRTDAGSLGRTAWNVTRAGIALTVLNWGNITDNPSYNFVGTGPVSGQGVVMSEKYSSALLMMGA